MGSEQPFESFDRIANPVKTLMLLGCLWHILGLGGSLWDSALFGSSWLQFHGWLLRNQPQDAALHRVALFIPSSHCWLRQWLRCIVRIPFVDAGNTQRQLPE